MDHDDEQFLRDIHAGLAVLKSQQGEINRRLSIIDSSIATRHAKRIGWIEEGIRLLANGALLTVAYYFTQLLFGVELKF